MLVQRHDCFFHNHTRKDVQASFEIEPDPDLGPLEVAVIDSSERALLVLAVPAGKIEVHVFSVPSGGKLCCRSGQGLCTWKGTTIPALLKERVRSSVAAIRGLISTMQSWMPPPRRERYLPFVYLLIIVWLNGYICRQAFFIEYTGRMNSIQGLWIAIARLAGEHWFQPAWWPYWYNGMPFEFTYAPLVPGLTAALARLSGFTAAHALQIVSAGVYCLSPAALFLMARQLTRRTGWSFIATLVYSFSAPTELLLPDSPFSLTHLLDARRLYLAFVWDELPHQFALALVCLATLFLSRAIAGRRFRDYVCAGVFVSLGLLASAFGVTAILLFSGCLLVTCETTNWIRSAGSVALCGTLAYLAMCCYLPPSLILAIQANGQVFSDMAWTASSNWAAVGALAGGILLWFLSRNWRPRYLRFFFLLTCITIVVPTVGKLWGIHFVPEPERYKVEMELALSLFFVFAIALLVDRLPKAARVVLALALLWPLCHQVIFQRRFSRNVIQPVDMTQTIEYQVAKWIEPNLPGWRVAGPGSFWPWLNTFSNVPQFSGGSQPTVANAEHMRIDRGLPGDPKDMVHPPVWYKAYGVDALIIPGVDSPEFWKPHLGGHQFDSVFPVIWEQRDTRIYAVPRPARTLAHVIPPDALVSRRPANIGDVRQAERYVAALERAAASPAAFVWLGDSRARVHAVVGASQVISVQVTYHPGWKAMAGADRVAVSEDALGQMVLHPPHPGAYDINLVYDGGWESWICRAMSPVVVLVVAVAAYRRRRPRASFVTVA